jgi:hypothetical protein
VEAFWGFLDLREHAGKDLKAQVLLIAQAIGTALKDADFVVETLDEAEGDFVLPDGNRRRCRPSDDRSSQRISRRA